MENVVFEVREEHIKLIKNMWTTWNYQCFGSPTIDPKRPYGRTLVFEDMAKIVGMGKVDEDGEVQLTDEEINKLSILHKETETVLQILLYNCSIKQGIYVNNGHSNKWILSTE